MTDTERIEYIRRRRSEKARMTEIARELKLSRERVRQLCLRSGITTTDPPTPRPPLICHGCGGHYCHPPSSGTPPYETATEHLRRTGHHPRPRSTPVWTPNETQARIIALHQGGKYTNRQIATTVGRTISVVSMTLRRAGLTGSYNVERDEAVVKDWKAGDTYATLQAKYKVSYLRIRQIIAGYIATGNVPAAKRG